MNDEGNQNQAPQSQQSNVQQDEQGDGAPAQEANAQQDVSATSSQGGFADSSKNGVEARMANGMDARNLYTKPIQRSHVIYPPPDGWIYWMSWNTIYVGDCRMLGAILYLYPDAMVFFQASTVSSSSGDVWLMKALQFYNQFNQPVGYPIPQHNGMNMAWEGSEYPLVFWAAIPGVGPTGAAQIRSATMTNHC